MKSTLLKQALKSQVLQDTLEDIAHDDKRSIDSFTDEEILHEARYVLSTYYEAGHRNNYDLSSSNKVERSFARKQVAILKKLLSVPC